ncbi:cytochrome c peroxidase [Haliea sp. E17]|uniref:cytochrome c peroxidase n=1 Tax=Haliea sp. E17 TaxID=3401576 RepID=UPI003AAFEE76
MKIKLKACTQNMLVLGAALGFLAAGSNAQPLVYTPQQQILADLGKEVFFDESLSTPGNKQGCVSCHAPERGWTFPDAAVNLGPVGNPGALPHARGKIKPPTVAYASFVRHFQPCNIGNPGGGRWCSGLFWDGRAEGTEPFGTYPEGDRAVSESVSWEELQLDGIYLAEYSDFLGPLTDQALNPAQFGIEQNAGEKKVCQQVKTAKYKRLYRQAFGERINCEEEPEDNPAFRVAFKRIALSLSAYQGSPDVNAFSSLRDLALYKELDCGGDAGFSEYASAQDCLDLAEAKPDVTTWGQFPLAFVGLGLPDEQIRKINRGHDLFYGVATAADDLNDGNPGPLRGNSSGPLGGGPASYDGVGTNAQCSECHSDNPGLDDGTEPRQGYADQAYHIIGIPFNRQIPNTLKGEVTGIFDHVSFRSDRPNDRLTVPGRFRTPTMREVGKGDNLHDAGFVKAFAHNGYFKSLEGIINFYGTRDLKPACEDVVPEIIDATEAEAMANVCWPEPEFPNPGTFAGVGILDLYPEEEAALAAYIRALTDTHIAEAP